MVRPSPILITLLALLIGGSIDVWGVELIRPDLSGGYASAWGTKLDGSGTADPAQFTHDASVVPASSWGQLIDGASDKYRNEGIIDTVRGEQSRRVIYLSLGNKKVGFKYAGIALEKGSLSKYQTIGRRFEPLHVLVSFKIRSASLRGDQNQLRLERDVKCGIAAASMSEWDAQCDGGSSIQKFQGTARNGVANRNPWAFGTFGFSYASLGDNSLKLETTGQYDANDARNANPERNRLASIAPIYRASNSNEERSDSEAPTDRTFHGYSLHDVLTTGFVLFCSGLGLGGLFGVVLSSTRRRISTR